MRKEFSVTGLLKPEFVDLPTHRIQAHHLSFDSFCRKVKKSSNIRFDAARDELGWVQKPQRQGEEQQHIGISSELTFQNALGVMRLTTTQSETPQELILHLWSPAPKEPVFKRSRRAHDPEIFSAGNRLESEANAQQPLGSLAPPVIGTPSIRSAEDTISDLGMILPVTLITPPVKHIESGPESSAGEEPLPAALDMTDNSRSLSANLDLSQPDGSVLDKSELSNSGVEDQGQEDPNFPLVSLAASTEYPPTDGEILLNMGALLGALNRDDIKAGEQQLGEMDEEYRIRVAEENEMLAELENQRFVDTAPRMFLKHTKNYTADFRPS